MFNYLVFFGIIKGFDGMIVSTVKLMLETSFNISNMKSLMITYISKRTFTLRFVLTLWDMNLF
jgi:hypothetical protein